MDDGIIQKGKRMRTSPPAGGISGIPAMGCPGIALILLQLIKLAHILGKPHSLKGSHILTAGKNIRSGHFCVDLHNRSGYEFFLIYLHSRQRTTQRRNEIPPNDRFIRDRRDFSGGDNL